MPARAPEVIAARKAALERAQASVVLAQKTYDRISQLAEHGNAPQARLDQVTDTLHESERAVDQAKSAYEQAVNGYTAEERQIAVANVRRRSPTSRPCNRSSIRWWSTRRWPRRSTSATSSRANTSRPACRW